MKKCPKVIFVKTACHFKAFNEVVSMDSLQNNFIIASENSDIIFVKNHVQPCTSNTQTTFHNIKMFFVRMFSQQKLLDHLVDR